MGVYCSIEDLRKRAENVLSSRREEKKQISYSEVNHIINDLSLHQIELDLQNESLQNAVLEINQSRNKYADLYDFIPIGYFILNQQGVILDVNQAGADLFEVKKNHLINQILLQYVVPSFQSMYLEHRKNILKDVLLGACEVKLKKKSGLEFYAEINSKLILNRLTGESEILTTIIDISDRKQKEEILHNQKFKIANTERHLSLEKLASVIAHELTQPLAITANYLHGSIHRLESGQYDLDTVIDALKKAAEQYHRTSEIIMRMKDYSCKGILHYEHYDINQLINESADLIKYETLDFHVSIQYYLTSNLPFIRIDKIQIQQVILNIARNAIEAMRDAETINPFLNIQTNQRDIDTIEVCITDNGPGISNDIIQLLFHHNFTTKSYGIGLGLAISQSIIEAHGGKLFIEPSMSRGACFKFTLPMRAMNKS